MFPSPIISPPGPLVHTDRLVRNDFVGCIFYRNSTVSVVACVIAVIGDGAVNQVLVFDICCIKYRAVRQIYIKGGDL